MAIATLSTCFNNPMVFQGVVKIRKGQAVTLMMDATNMRAVQTIIAQYSQEVGVSSSATPAFNSTPPRKPIPSPRVQILHKVSLTDPSRDKTLSILAVIQEKSALSQSSLPPRTHLSPMYLSAAMLLAALSWQYLSTTAAQVQGTGDAHGQ